MPKWMRTLALVLTVLAAGYLISRIPRPSTKPMTPEVPKEIARFEIQVPGRPTISFEKAEAGWQLKTPIDAPANDGNVVSFLASLRSLTLENVVSRRADSHPLFLVDEAGGVRLKVMGPGGALPLEWVVGKDSPSGGHIYVRKGNGTEVYLAKGLRRELVETDLKAWRDNRALLLAPDAVIQSVQVRRGKAILALERSSTSWTVNGKPADGPMAERMTNGLRYLSAEEFVDPPASLALLGSGFTAPSAEITVTLASGPIHVLRVGREEKGASPRVLLRRDDDTHLLWVLTRNFELLTADPKNLQTK